ncbi:MAG: phosphotransferase family protein [bacterium]|jgi:hypothetical protein
MNFRREILSKIMRLSDDDRKGRVGAAARGGANRKAGQGMEKRALLGRGRTAEVYEWGDDRALKLFHADIKPAWILAEAEIGAAVSEAGAPAPRVFGVIDLCGRKGIEYERVDGSSMLKWLEKKPWRVIEYARAMARLHYAVHCAHTKRLPAQRDKLSQSIAGTGSLTREEKDGVFRYLERLPTGMSLCHGDFHPDNILLSNQGMIAVDWTNAASGNALGDVARTCLMLESPYLPPGASPVLVLLGKALRRLLCRAYRIEYEMVASVTAADIVAWMVPMAAARLGEELPGEEIWLRNLVTSGLRRMAGKD